MFVYRECTEFLANWYFCQPSSPSPPLWNLSSTLPSPPSHTRIVASSLRAWLAGAARHDVEFFRCITGENKSWHVYYYSGDFMPSPYPLARPHSTLSTPECPLPTCATRFFCVRPGVSGSHEMLLRAICLVICSAILSANSTDGLRPGHR